MIASRQSLNEQVRKLQEHAVHKTMLPECFDQEAEQYALNCHVEILGLVLDYIM